MGRLTGMEIDNQIRDLLTVRTQRQGLVDNIMKANETSQLDLEAVRGTVITTVVGAVYLPDPDLGIETETRKKENIRMNGCQKEINRSSRIKYARSSILFFTIRST